MLSNYFQEVIWSFSCSYHCKVTNEKTCIFYTTRLTGIKTQLSIHNATIVSQVLFSGFSLSFVGWRYHQTTMLNIWVISISYYASLIYLLLQNSCINKCLFQHCFEVCPSNLELRTGKHVLEFCVR